jgi:pimeloyl-ACP methyl ester carboxylesterase
MFILRPIPVSTNLLRHALAWAMLLALASGCSSRPPNPDTPDVVFLVPGAVGDGGHYDELVRGLRAGGVDQRVEVVSWGMPGPLSLLNLQDDTIHRKAEAKLAAELRAWRQRHPESRVSVVAHSAGCGVTLGALALPDTPSVDSVVLLNPSVSPGYDLTPALPRIDDRLHVFHSDRDRLFLSWRTGTFGTYDNVKTKAAGNVGFNSIDDLPPELNQKVMQHGRDDTWRAQGNKGGHFGTCARKFVAQTIAPLLESRASFPAPAAQ